MVYKLKDDLTNTSWYPRLRAVLMNQTLLFVALGCIVLYNTFKPVVQSVALIDAPASGCEVEIERTSGFQNPWTYDVYIHPRHWNYFQTRIGSFEDVYRSNGDFGVDVSWNGPEELRIDFSKARAIDVPVRDLMVFGHHIKVTVRGQLLNQS